VHNSEIYSEFMFTNVQSDFSHWFSKHPYLCFHLSVIGFMLGHATIPVTQFNKSCTYAASILLKSQV